MISNSSLEDEIDNMAIRAWRMKLRSNSSLEDEITSSLQVEIGSPRTKLEMAQVEIDIQFKPGGRNHFEPGSKPLQAWVETTSSLEDEIEIQFEPGG